MKGAIEWFARNEVAANLLMAVILFLGGWALAEKITLEVFPEFERDVVNIAMAYRGATPAEVEEAVLTRAEEAIAGLEGIERMESTAYEGAGRVSVEVEKGVDPRALLDDIKNRVDAINTFPEEVERPVYSVQQTRREVISVVVSGGLPEKELRRLGERVRDDLAALPQVSLVELSGVRPFEISIEVSERALDRHGLTFDQIVEAVRRSSLDTPAGSLKTSGGEILLRTKGQAYTGEDFAAVAVLASRDGARLRLGDVASIRDGFEEEPLYARFNGKPAVMIDVYRTGRQNALDIGRAVKEYIDENRGRMPPGVSLDYWNDRSRIIKLRLETLLTNAWQGGLLVFLLLAMFLRMSVALWVCAGIPISFMGALALMPQIGVTINIMSVFAFILVLGILVDDAIVTGENIYSHLKRAETGLEAAVRGAQEVAVPVTFGLLTTLVAFVPLMFMEGRRGPIFAQIPLIVIPALMFSWVESKLILPAHMRRVRVFRGGPPSGFRSIQRAVADWLERAVITYYRPLLDRALDRRYLTFALFAGFSFVMISFVLSGRYGFTFFPRVQSETARATLSMNTGASEAITARHIDRIAREAESLRGKYVDPASGEPIIRNILMSVGWGFGGAARGAATRAGGSPELGQVSLEIAPPEERALDVTTTQIVSEWRKAIGPVPGAKELNFKAEIGRGGDVIDVRFTGENFDELAEAAGAVRRRLAEYPGVYDIQDSFEDGKPEIKLAVRPEAEHLGLSAADLGRQVRQAFFGAEAQRIQRGRDDVRVMVRYPEEERRSVASLDAMRIRTAGGVEVPIGNVADVSMGRGFAAIRRVDRQRSVNVTADADKDRIDVNRIVDDLDASLAELTRRHPGVRYTYEGELKEQRESLGSLFYGSVFVLFSIYALLAVPLRSYAQPMVIMLVIPFSVVGALIGHMLLGMNLSMMSLMGILALGGVVVNDSLVLVDWINQRRAEGMSAGEAARTAGVARFRPILLTSLTTFAGLGPLIFEKSTQAQFLIPMAVSLGFGILYATALSLLLTPAGYMILEDALTFFRRGEAPAADALRQSA